MKIDGKQLAEIIYANLKERVALLNKNGVTPRLAVVLIGDDPGSVSYVRQKEKHAGRIGAELIVTTLPTTVSEEVLAELVKGYNADDTIHGVIIQRPSPGQITKPFLDTLVIPEKDVDGFHPDSDYSAPVALAVETILKKIYSLITSREIPHHDFTEWLMSSNMVVMGKGETAGSPIISHFHGRDAQVIVIDSQTENPSEILNEADIIISAVGKGDVIPSDVILRNKILIGVGLHPEDGKLRGDYTDEEVAESALFYTPTPGGVGPVNVAMLLSNLVRAAEEQRGTL